MDALSTLIEEGRPEWYEALCGYCDGKAASWTFAALDPGGGRAKERLLAALWAALGRADRDSAGVFRGPGRTLVLVHAVRLLLREDGDIRPVAGADVLAYFLRAADLVPRDAAAERGADRSAAVTLEALKVVINLVTKVDANRVLFVQQHHAEVGLLARLRATTAPGQDDMLFLLYRLLAQVTCDETNACIVRAIGDSDALRLCERDVCSVTVFDAHGTENALMPQFIHEAYTAVFNLTLHLGRLKGQRTPPTPTELAVFKKLSVNMDLILQTRSEQLKLLRQAVASCLINSPQGWEHVVDPAGLARSVHFFLAAVRDGVGSSPYQFKAEFVVPHLMLLTGIMEEKPEMRAGILDTVFPPDYREKAQGISIDGPDVLRGSDSLGARLARFMTSPNVAVKHFVQEFLFLACNEDSKLLCSLVGVGNAAGLLKEKGLLGNFAQFLQPHPVSATPASDAASAAP